MIKKFNDFICESMSGMDVFKYYMDSYPCDRSKEQQEMCNKLEKDMIDIFKSISDRFIGLMEGTAYFNTQITQTIKKDLLEYNIKLSFKDKVGDKKNRYQGDFISWTWGYDIQLINPKKNKKDYFAIS